MIKIFIFLTCFGLLSGVAYSQDEKKESFWLGISGGYTHNNLITSTGYRPFTAYESKGGFVAGLPVVYHFTDWFGLKIEPSVVQKNYKWLQTGYYYFTVKPWQETKNMYIQLPLMAQFSFGGEKLRGFFATGAFAGYWADSHVKGVTIDNNYLPYAYNEPFEFDARRDNRFEYGLTLGLGLKYKVNSLCLFVVEGLYYYGASDLQKDYMKKQIPRYNDTYVLQTSILFNLFRNKNNQN